MVELSRADATVLWRAGKLRHKLHSGQKEAYDQYRAWEKASLEARARGEILPGLYPRVFVFDCSRRFGKDFLSMLIRIEDAIRRPGSVLTYGTAFQKDVSDILSPLFEKITEDCPHNLKPVFKGSFQGTTSGFYFPNKSIIKLCGLDKNPESLRGRFSDGVTLSEAAFVDSLRHSIVSVLMPQLQGRLHATILLNSTPPVNPGHPYDEVFCPDAIEREAYTRRTINDNPMLSDSERAEFIAASGGMESDTTRREYFCERIRSETRVVVPEFNPDKHVHASEMPEHALGFTVVDPGVRDICAVLCGYYDFERAKLVVRKDWGKSGANTNVVVEALRKAEHGAFSTLWFWNGDKFASNPFQRYSDTDARLITDLNSIHGLKIAATDKTDAEASLHAFRNAFQQDRIEVHPDCALTISHLTNAVWNKSRSSYERSDIYGHFDALDAARYMWRMCNKTLNPFPPRGVTLAKNISRDNIFSRPEHFKTRRNVVDVFNDVLPKGWRVRGR